MLRTRVGAAALVLLAMSLSAVPAAEAKRYRFKVDLDAYQETAWSLTTRSEPFCGSSSPYFVHRGSGSGDLRARLRGGRVTFRGSGPILESSVFRAPASAIGFETGWTTSVSHYDEDCQTPPNPQADSGDCGVRRRGKAPLFLFVVRGRIGLAGAFSEGGTPCQDQSLMTGVFGHGGTPARRDVDDLIRNRRVRSIELRSSRRGSHSADTLAGIPSGTCLGGCTNLEGSGRWMARWRIKLTRIR
jgi:hypothetical protein